MNVDFISQYTVPIIVGVCLCVGYIVKSWDKVPNKWIPTILAVIGVILSLWVNSWSATPEIILSGLASGLASCGLYDTFKHFIGVKKNE